MPPYKVFINLDILSEVPASGKAREQILNFIKSLADDPFQSGDYSDIDDVGRTIFTKIVASYAITYWADSPVREVKVR